MMKMAKRKRKESLANNSAATTNTTYIWSNPNYTTTGSTGLYWYNVSAPGLARHTILETHSKDTPIAVWVSGKMCCLGMVGSDVDCALDGRGKLIFGSGVITSTYSDRITVVVEYPDRINYYRIAIDLHGNPSMDSAGLLDAKLESTITKGLPDIMAHKSL